MHTQLGQTQKDLSASVSPILRLKVYAIPTSRPPAHSVFVMESLFLCPRLALNSPVTQLLLLIHTEYF